MNASVQTPGAARTVTLAGVGNVGQAIARAHFDAGVPVYLVECDARQLASAVDALRKTHPGLVTGEVRPWDGDTVQLLVRGSADDPLPQPEAPPLLIESVIERRDAKRALLGAAERRLGRQAVIATNTSTLRLADLATGLNHPERFLGLHFFMPVHLRPLVEVVRGAATDEGTVRAACAHAQRLGKPALVVVDSPGFVVNRMLVPYLSQSLHALASGAPAEQIERVARGAGMPLSPLELIDLIGMETAFHAGRAFWQAFPQRVDPSPLLPAMIKRGLLGVREGAGFYRYDGDGRRSEKLGAPAARLVDEYTRAPCRRSDPELTDYLLLPMLFEAIRVLRDGVVASAEAIDLAMRGGLGLKAPEGFWSLWDGDTGEALAERIARLAECGRTYQPPGGLCEALAAERSLRGAVERVTGARS